MTATTTLPTVHTAADPGPITLQPEEPSGLLPPTTYPRGYEPAAPYLIHLPGLGIVRLTHVRIDDYRTDKWQGWSHVRVSYTLHEQTKALRDHGGRRSLYSEHYIGGARRMGREAFEDQLAAAARAIIEDRDAEETAAALAADTARALRDDLTARAGALGVTVEWTDHLHPVLTPSLLGLILTTAEEANRGD